MLLPTSLRAKYIPNGHTCFPSAREQTNGLSEGPHVCARAHTHYSEYPGSRSTGDNDNVAVAQRPTYQLHAHVHTRILNSEKLMM